MKLVTFQLRSGEPSAAPRAGVLLNEDRVLDLGRAAGDDAGAVAQLGSVMAILQHGSKAMELARCLADAAGDHPDATYNMADVTLLSPVPRPGSLRDCLAFERHLINCMRTAARWRSPLLPQLDRLCERVLGRGFLRPPKVWYKQPIYYKGNPASVVGHEANVIWPAYTEKLDYELEFGVFIGKEGKNIREGRGAEHIAGYAVFNDFSARDVQLAEMAGRLGPAKGKDFDTGNAIGPWLTTVDEVPDPYDLKMTARVNGQTWSETSSRAMQFSFEEIIAHISQDETLYPGDFIGAGTAPGGCGLELDRWIQPGDVVELEVEHLGVLRNRVVRGT
ncbi:MAG: fumarylacetoacetate hydrolase family protein [Planctomycetales bacterium]|nr:fumarylacetoacetate hydrolase family protein [Planctomycetales bacterium]